MGISAFKARARTQSVIGSLLVGALAGCGTTTQAYTVRPLSGTVHPSDESWELDVAVEIADGVQLRVANASQEVVRIAWDDCAYIDVEGRSHRLLRARAMRQRDHSPQVPTAIAPGARIEDTLYPVADKPLNEDDPLLPSRAKPQPSSVWLRRLLFLREPTAASASVGKTVKVFLVFERGIGPDIKTLTTTYLISNVETTHRWWEW